MRYSQPRVQRRALLVALVAAAFWATISLERRPARAEAIDIPAEAVGRLNYAGYRDRRHCTMSAIGAHTVITASHCLGGLAPHQLHLLFGFDAMTYALHTSPVAEHDLGHDLTVLCLGEDDAPASLDVAQRPPRVGDWVTARGYGRPRVQRAHDTACTVEGVDAQFLTLGCRLTHGASGGPVLNADGAVVGVLSRAGATRARAVRVSSGVVSVCDNTP